MGLCGSCAPLCMKICNSSMLPHSGETPVLGSSWRNLRAMASIGNPIKFHSSQILASDSSDGVPINFTDNNLQGFHATLVEEVSIRITCSKSSRKNTQKNIIPSQGVHEQGKFYSSLRSILPTFSTFQR